LAIVAFGAFTYGLGEKMTNRLFRGGIVIGIFSLLVLAAGQARAAYVNGEIVVGLAGTSTYTGSNLSDPTSVTLATGIYTGSGTGDFSSVPVLDFTFSPQGTVATSTLTGTFAANSTESAYVADSVPDLFVFGGSSGRQYDFNLSSLAEQYTGAGLALYGQGTLVDSSNVELSSPASFTLNGLSDSGDGEAGGGSFTLSTSAPVPEPVTAGLMAVGGIALLGRRRRA
jgi:hypothetical protein